MTVIERRFRGERFDYEVKFTLETKRFDELVPGVPQESREFPRDAGRGPGAGGEESGVNQSGAPHTVFAPRLVIQMVRLLVAFGLVAIILASIVGQVVRDRYVAMAILFYLPLLPASLAALVFDLARGGRALPQARFLLTLLGIVGTTWAAIPMIGSGAIGTYGPTDTEVTLLHWNVLWGGGPFRSERSWAAERAEIRKRDPDLVILSELPRADWLAHLG